LQGSDTYLPLPLDDLALVVVELNNFKIRTAIKTTQSESIKLTVLIGFETFCPWRKSEVTVFRFRLAEKDTDADGRTRHLCARCETFLPALY